MSNDPKDLVTDLVAALTHISASLPERFDTIPVELRNAHYLVAGKQYAQHEATIFQILNELRQSGTLRADS